MNGLALCAGIGGIELGLKLACPSYRTICYVEREAYNAACLVKRMEEGWLDKAPIWSDINTFRSSTWRNKVDIVTAGAPCQPFSTAKHGRTSLSEDLWKRIFHIASEINSPLIFGENVPAGIPKCGGVAVTFSAASLGAPHRRLRGFFLGYPDSYGEPNLTIHDETSGMQSMENALWKSIPEGVRVDDGATNRVDRLRALGNAVVPAMAAKAFRALIKQI